MGSRVAIAGYNAEHCIMSIRPAAAEVFDSANAGVESPSLVEEGV